MMREINRKLRARCAALLLAAVCFRAAADAAVCAPSAVLLPQTEPERVLPALRFTAVAAEERTPLPVFSAADAAYIEVGGNCSAAYDLTALLLQEVQPLAKLDEPQVLIVHTHGSEAYTQSEGLKYEETGDWATLESDKSVIRVGEAVRAALEERGIGVIHDTAHNDYPVYNGAYDRMEATIAAYLAQYPSIEMVLDLHRDAFENPDGSAGRTAKDGIAQIMLVVGTDTGGLFHPDWEAHLGLAMQLQVLLERERAGITRPISLRTQRFNQHLTPYSLLVEVGATGDTLPEAIAAAEIFADSLADLLAP